MAAALQSVAPNLKFERSSSREFDLLLACCCAEPLRSARMRAALMGDLNWPAFLELSDRHKVVPLVARALREAQAIPWNCLADLQARERANTQGALWLTSELIRIVGHLQDHGIAALPYKGPVLAQLLYDDVAMRQFGDLDLLLRPSDVDAAIEALGAIGYSSDVVIPAHRRSAYIDSGYEYGFHGPNKNLVEIKWRPLPRFYSIDFDVDSLWLRATSLSIAEHSLATFAKEDLLLILAAHAAKHLWHKLAWICDLAQLSRDPGLDWIWIQKQAEELGLRRILVVTFCLGRDLLGSEIPPMAAAYLQRDSDATAISKRVQRFLFDSTEPNTESLAYFRWMAELRERRRDGRRIFFRLALTPSLNEWSAVALPSRLSSLYHLVRFGRLAKRFLQ